MEESLESQLNKIMKDHFLLFLEDKHSDDELAKLLHSKIENLRMQFGRETVNDYIVNVLQNK